MGSKIKNFEKRKKEKIREQNRRYRKKHPEIVKKCRINESKKQIHSHFCNLTRLLFKDILPKKCSHCGSKEDLHIHHKEYRYPIREIDLIVLCRVCHIEEHQKLDTERP